MEQPSIEQLRAVIKGSSVQATEDVLKATIDSIQYQLNLIAEQTTSETGSGETAATSDACANGAANGKESKNDHERMRTAPIELELEIKQVTVDSTEREPKWIICAKSPIPANIKLSKNLKFKDDASVYINYSSNFTPKFQIIETNKRGDMEILVECPAALLPTINHTIRGRTVIIQAEKAKDVFKKEYLNTRLSGKFEMEVPVFEREGKVKYDLNKISRKYENGVIVLTVPTGKDSKNAFYFKF
ncbi:unnamed protein product [Rotaria magnacalcarata]|uniref:SHSP domain-containing protein n=1 Tax=Rotaria magnacalcarata TaxID=392030 RepID=A0A814QTD8_9BILA|nr:unnamed protein product [Rotaria magnacalcarata]CAF4226055.1 unnamed protein product [Rotaria magnacalcarata]